MTDKEKLSKIYEYFYYTVQLDLAHPEDLPGECGMNIDDAYNLGCDYTASNIASDILAILEQ